MNVLVNNKALEKALSTLLVTLVSPYVVAGFPEDFLKYITEDMANCDGAVLVTSRGFEKRQISEKIRAPMYNVDLYVLYRSAIQDESAHLGGYEVIEALDSGLDDARLDVNNQPYKTKVLSGRFLDQIEGIFVWAMRLEVKHKLMRT